MPTFLHLADALAAAAVIGWIAVAVAAALDARRRYSGSAAAWAALIVALALPYVGAVLYAAARPRETLTERRHRRAAERYLAAITTTAPDEPAEAAERATPAPAAALVEQAAV